MRCICFAHVDPVRAEAYNISALKNARVLQPDHIGGQPLKSGLSVMVSFWVAMRGASRLAGSYMPVCKPAWSLAL